LNAGGDSESGRRFGWSFLEKRRRKRFREKRKIEKKKSHRKEGSGSALAVEKKTSDRLGAKKRLRNSGGKHAGGKTAPRVAG